MMILAAVFKYYNFITVLGIGFVFIMEDFNQRSE